MVGRASPLPSEFEGLDVKYVQRKSNVEYSSSCPNCGGVPHEDGSWPDRFILRFDPARGWCRSCGHLWFANSQTEYTPEQKRAWRLEREKAELQKIEEAEHALDLLNNERIWEKYHDNLTDELNKFYYDRHITDYFIEYWMLGYNPSKKVGTSGGLMTTPAFTIPVFEQITKRVLNIRNRLVNPFTPGDKYRPERKGLLSYPYLTDYDKKLKGNTLLVEGEFKAMTTYITLDRTDINVVGLPGKTPGVKLLDLLKDCDPVILCLDPDAYEAKNGEPAVDRAIKILGGKRTLTIRLPMKIDDMIIKGYLNKEQLDTMIKAARKQ